MINAIPRESFSVIQIQTDDYSEIDKEIINFFNSKKINYKNLDPNFNISLFDAKGEFKVLAKDDHQKFIECLDTQIDDIKIYTDFKPRKKLNIFTTSSHDIHYKERSTGEIKFSIEDKKLSKTMEDIFKIIKDKREQV